MDADAASQMAIRHDRDGLYHFKISLGRGGRVSEGSWYAGFLRPWENAFGSAALSSTTWEVPAPTGGPARE
jgi:hypothetical protein